MEILVQYDVDLYLLVLYVLVHRTRKDESLKETSLHGKSRNDGRWNVWTTSA